MDSNRDGGSELELAKSDRGWISGVVGDDVVTIGDPRLKAVTRTVEDIREVADLIDRMTDRVRSLNGAGLAAPQIGESVKVIVVEVRRTDVFPDRPTSPLMQLINPVIVERSPDAEIGWEGCFSVPGFMGLVSRASEVTVESVAVTGEMIRGTYAGYLARVLQHEVDHLDGIEFVDRMTSMESFTTVSNYLKNHRSKAQ